ncbi:RNA pyrophosphohydrolase [Notoacmeibacter ruber]|uniref:RNA pyrophosphohydrolase n=1 Tax=Notoacmeibacter ruber TaxID=2670375 RepID=A0A3L7JEP3_9HYPH|nr:RNA pyrophosphohydrolase [Notoacmeibacter ruber]RLQ88950.1 RNA pyrophosphohydrolase [Notoacmeibacter ruber]
MPNPNPDDLPYRPCVGVMLLNRDGLVWTGHRKTKPNSEEHGSGHLWQMPQGGIDKGEEPEAAALRELYEETGIRSVHLLAETSDWLTYDLPSHLIGKALKGKYRGQKQRWFAYRFEGDDSEIRIDPPPEGHTAEFDAWDWKPMKELPGLIVPFKRSLYEQVVTSFRHLSGSD